EDVPELLGRSCTAGPEAEVRADHHPGGTKASDEKPLDEGPRLEGRELAVEREQHQALEPQRGGDSNALHRRLEELRRALGSQELQRMRLERHGRHGTATLRRELEQHAMAAMKPVECTHARGCTGWQRRGVTLHGQ